MTTNMMSSPKSHSAGMLPSPELEPIKWDRLLIVANRLPVTAKGTPPVFTPSSGGLVTGVTSLKSDIPAPPLWIGWPGVIAPEHVADAQQKLKELGFAPVILTEQHAELFYDGYCNGTLWPMLHSMPMYSRIETGEWEAYVEANKKFAEVVLANYVPGDLVWVHDYHLFLLPKMLHEKVPEMPILFFLHVPFPTVEILKLLPNHKEILQGLLHCDLVGFHTADYVAAFSGCVTRCEGLPVTLGRIIIRGPKGVGRVVQLGNFPMGIDFHKYHDKSPELTDMANKITAHLNVEKLIFSVGRLDYTKGIPNSLTAIKELFHSHPEMIGKVCYALVVVPSRTSVSKYETLKQDIDRLVGEINGEFSSLTWTPVIYLYKSLSLQETVALYGAADVGFITPLRDGLNLCAKEYAAAHAYGDKGVLVLGNLAGAAAELIDAVQVNPNSTESMVAALMQSLTMTKEERLKRNNALGKILEANDIQNWGTGIFKSMNEALEFKHMMEVEKLSLETETLMREKFAEAKEKLIVLDYDGTLVPFHKSPSAASPDPELLDLLTRLGSMSGVTLALSSGRDKETMEKWFHDLPVTLVAEHGSYVKCLTKPDAVWKLQHTPLTHLAWKEKVREAMNQAVAVLPGSFVEEKEFGLVYHWRAAETTSVEAADSVIKNLRGTLTTLLSGTPLRVFGEKKALEVGEATVSKGSFVSKTLQQASPDLQFVLAIGDDITDEDMFGAVVNGGVVNSYTIRVGNQISQAQYTLSSFFQVRSLLAKLLPRP